MLLLDAADEARYLAVSHLKRWASVDDGPTALRRIRRGLGIGLQCVWIGDARYTGSSFVNADGHRFIVVNRFQRHGRLVFTVAHEIGHLVMGHRPPRRSWHERLANVYAGELLMPERRVLAQVRQFGPDPWLLATVNGVSVAAMRWRLKDLGV